MAERRTLVKALIDAGLGECQIGVTLRRAMILQSLERGESECERITDGVLGCTHEPSGIHELRKRSAGGSLTLLANLLPACSHCNQFVEREPEIAHSLGLVCRPGDPTWFMLGADRGGF